MSNEALTWAFRQDLPLTQKFVLVALADYADENGECFPKHERTAQRTGTSVSTVKRAIKSLTETGYLTTTHQYRDDGRFRANRYRLNIAHDIPGQSDPVGGSERTDHQPRVTPLPGQSDPNTGSEWASKNPQENPHRNPQENLGAAAADAEAEGAIEEVFDDPTENRPEVEELCNLLADCIEANGSKRPTITDRWRDAARLLLDRDGRTTEQVAWIIQWSQTDEFWRGNILSMPTLRRQFDRLRLKAVGQATPTVSAREREIQGFLDAGQGQGRRGLGGVGEQLQLTGGREVGR